MSALARVLVTAASALVVACSLLTDTNGLTGGTTEGGADSAIDGGDSAVDVVGTDGAPTDDGASGDGSAATDAPGKDASTECIDDAGCSGGPCAAGRCLVDPVVVASAGVKLFGLAVTDTTVYFAGNTRIYARALDGGAVSIVDDGGALGQMAHDDTYLYFPRNGDISRTSLAVGGSSIIHSQVDSPITAVATTTGAIVFAAPTPGFPGPTSLFALTLDGGPPSVIVTDAFTYADAVHATASDVYVADRAGGAVFKLRGGSAPAQQLLTVSDARGVFVEEPLLWVTSNADGAVYRTLADGTGTLEPIALGQSGLSQVVATKTAIYFLAGMDVMKVAR